MYIKCLPLGPVAANCYVLTDGTGVGAVVDPGDYTPALENEIQRAGITELKYILCTHGHFDHVSGAQRLKQKHPEAQIVCGADDAPALESRQLSLAEVFGLGYDPCTADKTVTGGDGLTIGSLKLTVIGAPGHSLGGVMYYCPGEGVMFTGDTLFRGSVGRTDLYGGDYSVLLKTLKKFVAYPPETVVYSGHGESSTIDFELKYNPYLK